MKNVLIPLLIITEIIDNRMKEIEHEIDMYNRRHILDKKDNKFDKLMKVLR
ncbi:hypothetical protein J6W34_05100 [bacterium]|nr:hypothetical protein [bacterium]